MILVIALLLAGFVVFFATRSHEPAKVAVRDAAAVIGQSDAPLIVQPGPLDAEVEIDAAMIDAALPIDAGGHTVVRHHDAGAIAVKPDAAAMAVAPAGTGHVTIRALEGSSSITIDDGGPLTPPVNHRKLAAGKHTIKFYDGKSNALLDTQAIVVVDGGALTVVQQQR